MEDPSVFDMISDGSDYDVKPVVKAKAKATKAAPKEKPLKKAAQPKPKTTKPKSTVPKKRVKDENESDDESDHVFDDESLLNDTPPKAKKPKLTANPVKSPHQKPLAELVAENIEAEAGTPKGKKKKRVSEQYTKLTQLEHILKRPDTYIGSIEKEERKMWVYNTVTSSMEYREISYVPGLFKIFDEILVNAADNKQNDAAMKEIKVNIDQEKGEISVHNDGKGIPIEIHSKEQVYIPELIFGHLLAGSNFDDNEQKVTGGRNGYGAKLCNIFSTEFTIETSDKSHKKKYKQTWKDNMNTKGQAKIADTSSKEDYTKVTFKPDFGKFGLAGLDTDHTALFTRRVYDLAGTVKGVKVSLNGTRLPIKDFKSYCKLYTNAIKQERGEEAKHDTSEIILEAYGERWEVGFAVSDGSFQQVSFVNSIATTVGGKHVDYIADQIVTKLQTIVQKKDKKAIQLKPNQIRNHIFVFINCLIVNPAFSSQTKDQLTVKASAFGSKCQISDEFMKKVAKTQVIENIMAFASQKADQLLKKTDGTKRSRMHDPKLVDANKAGTKDGHLCTLILTEGDSAKGMAMAGRAIVGADLFGVFPLRGKLLNVRDASVDQISKNKEIQNIKNFLGLQHKKEYTDTKGLRYGHLMIMTDQDHDGSHIKGLLINFLHAQFPSLLRLPGFLVEFITPIVKTYKGDSRHPTASKAFYTMPEYLAWKEAHVADIHLWDHKYYKGLGTSTTEESQEYFNDLDKHHKDFDTMQEEEEALIELAFSKRKADERKEWLRQFKPGTFFDYSVKSISYTDFINKELILFSMADNFRSIPSVIDGFKPTQRKVLYTCFKKNIKKDMKVYELAGLISGLTAYQHGDASLQQTIVGLAQSFVGSNNVNCLEPAGQFGTRLQGGADAASARYIYTRLSPFARKLFLAADEPLLKYNTDDGHQIEPEMYVPVIPMVLVNGSEGIGTGWSSSIPNYNPIDIVDNLRRRMAGEAFLPMKPWFRGFKGTVTEAGPDKFKFSGIASQEGNEIEITELPVRVWTQDFKEKLEEIIKAEKAPSWIKDYKDYNTHKDVRFTVLLDDKNMKSVLEDGLEERFKLSKTLGTTNLVAFDPEGRITKYNSIEAILDEFYAYRLKFYQKRKDSMLEEMNRQLRKLTNQARFVQMIIDNKLVISRKKKGVLIAELQKLSFDPFPKAVDASKAGELEKLAEENDEDESSEAENLAASSYDYLLGMALWSLTQERVERLKAQIGNKEQEIEVLLEKSKEDLWHADLDEFVREWEFQLEDEKKRARIIRKGRRTSKKFGTGATTKKRGGADDSDDDFQATKKKAAPKPKPAVKKAELINKKKIEYVSQETLPKKAMTIQLVPITKPPTRLKTTLANKTVRRDDSDAPKEVQTKINGFLTSNGVKTEDSDDELIAVSKPARATQKKSYAISDVDSESEVEVVAKPKARPASNPTKQVEALHDESEDEITTKAKAKPAPKAIKKMEIDDDSDSNGDSFLAGISILAKGTDNKAASKPKPVVKVKAPAKKQDSDTEMTGTAKVSDPFEMSDDDEPIKPVKKVAAKKDPVKAKPAKAPAKKPAPKKAIEVQSPASKAYAKRLAKKKAVESDDDMKDVDAIADDLLDSGASDDEPVKPAARTARRAVVTKKKTESYDFDDSDDAGAADGFSVESEASEAFTDDD